jgi:glycosyltransferase involved in cell wall biosynthesis
VHAAEPDARLVIAGPDDEGYGAQVRSDIEAHNLRPYVTFTGMLQGQEKLELLADADAWVLPSYTENFGLAVLEALCCGLPTVISDRINIHRELIQADAALVTVCDATAVAHALLRILREPGLAARLGDRGRTLAGSYSWARTAELMVSVYVGMATGHVTSPEPIRERS